MWRARQKQNLMQHRSELSDALASCRSTFVAMGCISAMSNILMLTGSFFMLEVYDRVLPSHSLQTLIGLVILAAGLFLVLGLLDIIRGRILVRVGGSLDETLSGRIYDAVVRLPLKVGNRDDALQPLRDLDSVRSFLSGFGPIALFDMPWLPIYLGICFLFHPYIGFAALAGAIILGVLTLLTEVMTRTPAKVATGFAVTRNTLADTQPPQRRGVDRDGNGRPIRSALERRQRQIYGKPAACQRRGRRVRRHLQGAAHGGAIQVCSRLAPIW